MSIILDKGDIRSHLSDREPASSLDVLGWCGAVMSPFYPEGDLAGTPCWFSPSVRRQRCSQVGCDVLRQHAVVLRYAPRVIRTKRAQKSAPFPGRAPDVLARLQLCGISHLTRPVLTFFTISPQYIVCVAACSRIMPQFINLRTLMPLWRAVPKTSGLCWLSRGGQSPTPYKQVSPEPGTRSLWPSNVICKTALPRVFDLTNRVCVGPVCAVCPEIIVYHRFINVDHP
jgi:hypothetical protein